MHLQYTLREIFEKRPARRHSCSFLFSVFVICTKTAVDAEWTMFSFFEMLTIKYDRMALVNIEKLQTLTMQRWLQLFVCRSCTSTYWPGMPFLRLSYWRSHQIPTTRDLKKVPLCFLFLQFSTLRLQFPSEKAEFDFSIENLRYITLNDNYISVHYTIKLTAKVNSTHTQLLKLA